MGLIRDLWSFAKVEIRERLFPSVKRRNRLLLRAGLAADTLSPGSLRTVRETAAELVALGYEADAFFGVGLLSLHPQLVSSSEFGQEVWTAVLEFVPCIRTANPEHYFENVLAACVNVLPGGALEQRCAALLPDAFGVMAARDQRHAIERVEGLLEYVSPSGMIGQVVQELVRAPTRDSTSGPTRRAPDRDL